MIATIGRILSAWLHRGNRPHPGGCAEFDSDPYRYTRSPWIKSLINSPLFHEAVPTLPYDVVSISHPERRTGRLFIKDMLRLERMIRFGSRGLYSTMGDNITRALYREEFDRLAVELHVTCPGVSMTFGGSFSPAEVQQAAASVIDCARKARR